MGVWQWWMHRVGSSELVGRVAPKVMPPTDRLLHRLSGGRLHLMGDTLPTLMLTSTGRRSGEPRQQPLAYVEVGGGAGGGWAVVGTNYGQDHHPAWTHNLLAHPEATVEVGGDTHAVRARQVERDTEEHQRLWARFVELFPPYATYLERTARRPRLFVLEPR